MRIVGLKVLKNKLSEYVRLAERGETVLISDRDRVVAELVPPQASRAQSLPDAVIAELVRTGVLTPPMHVPAAPPAKPAAVAPLADLLRELDRERDER